MTTPLQCSIGDGEKRDGDIGKGHDAVSETRARAQVAIASLLQSVEREHELARRTKNAVLEERSAIEMRFGEEEKKQLNKKSLEHGKKEVLTFFCRLHWNGAAKKEKKTLSSSLFKTRNATTTGYRVSFVAFFTFFSLFR